MDFSLVDHIASIATLVGFPLVMVGLLDLYRERALNMHNWRKWVGILLLTAGAAAYAIDVSDRFGWIGHHQPPPSQISETDRVAMKALISVGIKEGEALCDNWFAKDADGFKHESNLWTNRIGHLIEDAYGAGEASLLMSDAGYIGYSDGKKQTDIRNWIIHRLQRLNELIPRVDSLTLQPTFDAKNYHWADKCPEC
jgi:hypothetical protein